MKKIIGFAGSTSSTSINKQLADFTLSNIVSAEFSTELLDLREFPLPIYNIDVERTGGFPDQAHRFINKLKEADAFIVSMAEHNGSYAAEVKNLIDWCSRIEIGFFFNKPMLLMSTSPGGYGGGNVLKAAADRFPKFKANLIATYKLPSFNDNFSKSEGITNTELLNSLKEQYSKLAREV